MGAINSTGYKTFTATAVAITAGARVAVNSSGVIAASGAANDWIGTAIEDIAASGAGTVRLRSSPGTFHFIASAAITVGNVLYPTASGKVDDAGTTGGAIGFVAIEAATADGDVIEAAPIDGEGSLTLGDGQNIPLGTATGTKIGTAVAQKLGFWNVTPVIQPVSANQTAVTDNTGGSVADAIAAVVTDPGAAAAATAVTSAALTTSALGDLVATNNGWGASSEANFDSIATKFDQLVTDISAQKSEQDKLVTDHANYITVQTANSAAIVALTNGLAKTLELVNQLRSDLVTTGIIKGSA